MLLSLALIFLLGLCLGKLAEALQLPPLLGMIVAGVLLGPSAFRLLDPVLLGLSAELRQIALIIILCRAGLSLHLQDLKQVGRPAVLLCFLPACLEILGTVLLAPALLGVTRIEAALLGAVLAAVSPAVIVPRMLGLMARDYGTKKGIPQMIMAAAAVDDVFVIVIFTALTGLLQNGSMQAALIIKIPSAIVLGLCAGLLVGFLLRVFFSKCSVPRGMKLLIILCISFILVTIERSMTGVLGFSGLLAVMALGGSVKDAQETRVQHLSADFAQLWTWAEILLFVLLGATIDLAAVRTAGLMAVLLIAAVLLFRMVGVFLCLIKTQLNRKERIFTACAYIPKATVQAAIGGLPLAMGLACGELVLVLAALSILLTAPLGAVLMDMGYAKLLQRGESASQ